MSKKCPRGFTLIMKYERYFFKESKECKPGYEWCPITKKCVPEDEAKRQGRRQGRGQGSGPMGKPMKEANDLVDIAFDEGFEIFAKAVKTYKKVDQILDALDECGMGMPGHGGMMGGGRMNKGIADIEPEESEEEYETDYTALPNDAGENDIDHVPNQYGPALYAQIVKQLGEIKNMSEGDREAYKAYFDGMLKKFGVSSPAQLDGAKKKQFFNAVDKGWKAKKEKVSEAKSKMK
jgi:hypothetical protein